MSEPTQSTSATKSVEPAARYRDLPFGVTEARVSERDSAIYLEAAQALDAFPKRLTERFLRTVETAPDRCFIARRMDVGGASRGDWQQVSYADAHRAARSIGQWLLDRGASVERPLAIVSENSIEHALLALGAMLVGVPYCSVSPAYSLVSQDFEKLRHVLNTITPSVVYAADRARYGKAITAMVAINAADAADVAIVFDHATAPGDLSFGGIRTTPASDAVDRAYAATDENTIVKFLFTSGSTKLPKGVINTQRMLCANQQQMQQSMPAFADAPPVLLDWLPWNHTFGGNHNFGLVLYQGGTLYIDDGKPTPAFIGETLRNLREIAPTFYFNVPTGFEAIANAMESDAALRKNLLSNVRMFFYAGAALAQPVWDKLFATAESEIGERIVMTTGLGMTESAPFGLFVTSPNVKAGDLGLPTPGLQLKLVQSSGKMEVRYKGPNVTPGYWRNNAATGEAFDEEGYFCTGDAVRWIDPENQHLGLRFDGRIAEDFKLATGTFVSVGPMRATLIAAFAPYVQDAVITGINRHEVGAMLFPIVAALRKLSGLPDAASLSDIIAAPPVRQHFQSILDALAAKSQGSSSRVARLCILDSPPSLDRGEITDKGSINQNAVLTHRAEIVEALHGGALPEHFRPAPQY